MKLNFTKEDMKNLEIMADLNPKQKTLFLFKDTPFQVMRNGSNMIRIRLDNTVSNDFGIEYKKLATLYSIQQVGDITNSELSLVESNNKLFVKASNPFQNTQLPVEDNPSMVKHLLPTQDDSFDVYKEKIEKGLICHIIPDNNNPSIFKKFSSSLYSSLNMEGNNIRIYKNSEGNIVIEVGTKSINQGSIPSGGLGENRARSEFVRSTICTDKEAVGTFPDNVFVISRNIYEIIERNKQDYSFKLGAFTHPQDDSITFIGIYFYSDNVEYITILSEDDG